MVDAKQSTMTEDSVKMPKDFIGSEASMLMCGDGVSDIDFEYIEKAMHYMSGRFKYTIKKYKRQR